MSAATKTLSHARQSGKLLNRNAQQYDIHTQGELILIRLRAGDYFKTACARVGVAYSTAKRWLRLGQGGVGSRWGNYVCREEHVWFAEEVARALAEVEGDAVDAWMAEIQRGNWQAARDFLARRFPRRWGMAQRHESERLAEAPAEIQLVLAEDQYHHADEALPPAEQPIAKGADHPALDPDPIPVLASPSHPMEKELRGEVSAPSISRVRPQGGIEELHDRLQSLAFLAGQRAGHNDSYW